MNFYAMTLVNGVITVLGAAEPQLADGKMQYLCRTCPPLKPYFEICSDENEVVTFLRNLDDDVSVISGNVVK